MPPFAPPSAEAFAELYDAAFDDDAWIRLGDRLAALAGVNTAGFWIMEDNGIAEMVLSDSHRETAPHYTAHYAAIDPWAAAISRLGREQLFLSAEHVAEEDLVRTEFYNDFAKPFGHLRPLGAMLTIAPGVAASVSLENRYATRLFDVADKQRLAVLLPHIKRIIQLRRRFQASRAQQAVGAASLNMLSFGVVVCDGAGQVVTCNRAAETIGARLGVLVLSRQASLASRLRSAEGRTLEQSIADAASGGAGGVVRLPARDGSGGVIALVTPLPAGILLGRHGLVMVSLRPVDEAPAYARTVLSAVFGLTPAQSDIAMLLFKGASAEDITRLRNIRMPTCAAIWPRSMPEPVPKTNVISFG